MSEGSVTHETRFSIPKDSIGYLRLRETQEVIKSVKGQYPEVLSLCVYGSNTKGRARNESDIDGWLFVDAAQVSEKIEASEGDVIQIKDSDNGIHKSRTVSFVDDISNRYNHLVRTNIQTALSLEDDQVRHIRTLPISESIIDDRVDSLLAWDEETQRYQQDKLAYDDKWVKGLAPAIQPQKPDTSDVGQLPYMFHLAIGRGIERYRDYLITKLLPLGDKGERIWKEIVETTERMENRGDTKTGIIYPSTLTAAKEMYGVNEQDKAGLQ